MDRFLDEEDRIVLRQAGQQVLRPLEDKVPAQVAKYDDRWHDDSFVAPRPAGRSG
jgi:hypothetical protein